MWPSSGIASVSDVACCADAAPAAALTRPARAPALLPRRFMGQNAAPMSAALRPLLYGLFAVSGFCGLIYESIWSHYLRNYLGHAAHGQTVVLVIFVGGLALGAWLAARRTERLAGAAARVRGRGNLHRAVRVHLPSAVRRLHRLGLRRIASGGLRRIRLVRDAMGDRGAAHRRARDCARRDIPVDGGRCAETLSGDTRSRDQRRCIS